MSGAPSGSPTGGFFGTLWNRIPRRVRLVIVYVADTLAGALLPFVAGIAFLNVYSWYFPPPKIVTLIQSGLGQHCPVSLFNEAERSGIHLTFAPPQARFMAVCGPAEYDGRDVKASVVKYLKVSQSPCFTTEARGDNLTVRPNIDSGQIVQKVGPTGNPNFFCRCDANRQVPLILERGDVCGQS